METHIFLSLTKNQNLVLATEWTNSTVGIFLCKIWPIYDAGRYRNFDFELYLEKGATCSAGQTQNISFGFSIRESIY